MEKEINKNKITIDDSEERVEGANWPVIITLLVLMVAFIGIAFYFLAT